MPDWLKNALFWIVVVVVMVILAATSFSIALYAGLGWAIVVAALVAAFAVWLDSRWEVQGVLAIPMIIADAVGLIAGAVWLLYAFILRAVS